MSLSQPSRTPLLVALIYFPRDQKGMSPLCFEFSLTLPPRGTKRGTHSLGGVEAASEYTHSHKHDFQTALCAAHTSPWPHLGLTSASPRPLLLPWSLHSEQLASITDETPAIFLTYTNSCHPSMSSWCAKSWSTVRAQEKFHRLPKVHTARKSSWDWTLPPSRT